MTNQRFLPGLLMFATLFPAGAFAQKPDENWLGALSMESGVVSATSTQSATLFAAAGEFRRPHIPGGFLRVELGGWRADVLENGMRIARWDQSLGFGLMHAFGHRTGIGALTPALGLGLGLHALGQEEPGDGTGQIHSTRTLHPAAFMDASVAFHLTRTELLSLEVGGRYTTIGDAPDQVSLRIGMRVHPGSNPAATIHGENAALAANASTDDANPDGKTHTRGATVARTVELNMPTTSFAEPTQLTREKSIEVKTVARKFLHSDENAGAEIVAFTNAADVRDGSATLRAATVARALAAAGVRTDRLRILVRLAADTAADVDNVRVRLTH